MAATAIDSHHPHHIPELERHDEHLIEHRRRSHHRRDYDDGIGIDSSGESTEGEEEEKTYNEKTGLLESDDPKMWDRLKRLSGLLNRGDVETSEATRPEGGVTPAQTPGQPGSEQPTRPTAGERRPSKKAIASLPRPGTFKRQQSELREKLTPHERCAEERRVASACRSGSNPNGGGLSRTVSPAAPNHSQDPPPPFSSLPPIGRVLDHETGPDEKDALALSRATTAATTAPATDGVHSPLHDHNADPKDEDEPPPPFSPVDAYSDSGMMSESIDEAQLNEELERRWILNLSMHFRDRSDREKFFITYAETPNRWRRVTVSCDYRDAQPDSLELDLKGLRYQRDKNSRIYESIRESLPDIQFYNSVTNLKLQTSDGRLHVHVTEDVNEIIPYPPVSAVGHLTCPRFKESSLQFEAHMSGYVYKVSVDGQVFVKKEIPGPDSVDEFLYEINALNHLQGSKSVIEFGGVIVDDEERLVKGLLISYADQGALVDLLYDERGHIPWARRERWAQQIVQGLSEIHEGGFVQGDFTLSNIVIDANDDAKIIDINRRGCPVGWEPPELAPYIESNQRISMYIGVKSDLFQLGMVLWALAEEQDEPELHSRPLTLRYTHPCHDDLPKYFLDAIEICLDERPHNRLTAKELLVRFPEIDDVASRPAIGRPQLEGEGDCPSDSPAPAPGDKQYIDPCNAVEREDIDRFRQGGGSGAGGHAGETQITDRDGDVPQVSEGATYVNATKSSDTGYGSSPGMGTYVVPRGRTGDHRWSGSGNGSHKGEVKKDADGVVTTIATSEVGEDEMPGAEDDVEGDPQIISVGPAEGRWEEIHVEGHPYLIDRKSVDLASREAAGPDERVHEINDDILPPLTAPNVSFSTKSAKADSTSADALNPVGYNMENEKEDSTALDKLSDGLTPAKPATETKSPTDVQ